MCARFCILMLAGLVCAVTPALACSPLQDYVRPTNFELVGLADAIVVATAVEEVKRDRWEGSVVFRVDRIIKGSPPGQVQDSWGNFGEVSASNPNDISEAHPDAMGGMCNRVTYRKNAQYVLFLEASSTKERNEKWDVAGWPFSRVNEDYFGENSLWIRTIRLYLDVRAKHEPMEQLRVLYGKYQDLAGGGSALTTNNRALAQDIAGHLMAPSPRKPTEHLLQTHEALDTGGEVPFAVRVPDSDGEPTHASALSKFIFHTRFEPGANVDGFKLFILWCLINADHADAMPLFERLAASPALTPGEVGAVARYYSKYDRYREAIELVKRNAFRIMSRTPYDDVKAFLRGVRSMHFGEGSNWQDDEFAKALWPDFLMSIHATMMLRFGEVFTFEDVLKFLRPGDYRERPDVALALADSFDEQVVDWAEKEVRRLLEMGEELSGGAYELPIGILLEGLEDQRTSNKRPRRIDSVICLSPEIRLAVITYLGRHYDLYTLQLGQRLAALDLNEQEKEALMQSAAMFVAERAQRTRYGTIGGNWEDSKELLMAIVKEEPIDLKADGLPPIRCH